MYNAGMSIILFFVVLSAWCGQAEFFEIPSCWTRDLYTGSHWKLLHPSSCIPNLERISIMRQPPSEVEHIVFTAPYSKDRLAIDMDASAYDLEIGAIFSASFSCDNCKKTTRGHVASFALDGQNRRFMVAEPKQDPELVFVRFSNMGSYPPDTFCEYNAEKTRFIVSRFLCEYSDESRYFVSAQMAYANMRNVVIEWGIRDSNGVVQDSEEEQRKEFNFPACACRMQTA